MWDKNYEDKGEQRILPIVVIVIIVFLASGFFLKDINYQYYDLPHAMADLHEHMYWKLTPGW